jgi:hypothetical protein
MVRFKVGFLKADTHARFQGAAFFFKEGFCWTDINTIRLKCREKTKSINDVKSMSLYSLTNRVPEYFIMSIINSNAMSCYVNDFINNTQTFQINDARQLPMIIPTHAQLDICKPLVQRAIELKKMMFYDNSHRIIMEQELLKVEKNLDEFVNILYHFV